MRYSLWAITPYSERIGFLDLDSPIGPKRSNLSDKVIKSINRTYEYFDKGCKHE